MSEQTTQITPEYKLISKRLTNGNGGFVFLTGKAGTGKTTFIRWFLDTFKIVPIILAPTGRAAVQAKGQTIHSFFKFKHHMVLDFEPKDSPELTDILKKCDVIVIDEISMVRADLLDNINKSIQFALNSNVPFGGKLILAIGDLYQLPPVLTESEAKYFELKYDTSFFFGADVFNNCKIETFQLTKVFRQTDQKFLNLLNLVREGRINQNIVNRMNKAIFIENMPENYEGVVLCSTNRAADAINTEKISKIESPERQYFAEIEGNVDVKNMPVDAEITLKVGAKVILCKNTPDFKNGEIGIVTKLRGRSLEVKINNRKVDVIYETFEVFEYKRGKAILAGKFKMIPVKLGWAISIHKSQGMTFDCELNIHTGNGCFASGQFYVALSRATKFENVKLLRPLSVNDIRVSSEVVEFMKNI